MKKDDENVNVVRANVFEKIYWNKIKNNLNVLNIKNDLNVQNLF